MFPELSARVLDRKFVFVLRSIVSAGTASCLKVNLNLSRSRKPFRFPSLYLLGRILKFISFQLLGHCVCWRERRGKGKQRDVAATQRLFYLQTTGEETKKPRESKGSTSRFLIQTATTWRRRLWTSKENKHKVKTGALLVSPKHLIYYNVNCCKLARFSVSTTTFACCFDFFFKSSLPAFYHNSKPNTR